MVSFFFFLKHEEQIIKSIKRYTTFDMIQVISLLAILSANSLIYLLRMKSNTFGHDSLIEMNAKGKTQD